MFLSLFTTFFVAVAIATILLITLGHRVRVASRAVGVVLGVALAAGAGELVGRLWALPPRSILVSQLILVAAVGISAVARSAWNPLGQMFFGTFMAAAGTYVVFAVTITFLSPLSILGFVVSVLLLVLEIFALTLSAYFVFEGCDVVCRTRPTRPAPRFDPSYAPMVSLQVPAYNEPPDMLIETIRSLEGIDYPNLEIVVIDNNTTDPELWEPVAAYCRDRDRVRFVHESDVPGFKAGALNLVMAKHMDPRAEIIGVVDADYRVDPSFLRSLVGYFADPKVAFVQSPQDYKDYEGKPYLTACYDAYNYFFVASMPFRNERNSIIFAGTMGLIRRSALEEIGGWPEWCITEDAETSFRLLRRGFEGVYVPERFGVGIMPLTFSAFKGQRFRWAFGGIQILRKHFRDMLPGRKTATNQLSQAQRFDYLLSGFMWFNDLLYLGFSLVLFATAFVVLAGGSIELRPLRGAIVLLPAALIASGVVRALWSLRVRSKIGVGRGLLAFANWLSLSWTVALACLQHLFRSEASFLRTPKEGVERNFLNALRAAKAESIIAGLLWSAAVAVAVTGKGTAFLFGLFAWQGLVYASAPLMSWLNVREELSPELERRRQSEYRRERLSAFAPVYVGAAAVLVALAVLFAAGGSQPSDGPIAPLELPRRAEGGGRSPLSSLADEIRGETQPPTAPEVPTPAPSSAAPTNSPQPTSGPTPTPTPTPTPSAVAASSATPPPTAAEQLQP